MEIMVDPHMITIEQIFKKLNNKKIIWGSKDTFMVVAI
jgi:hypothetical protein